MSRLNRIHNCIVHFVLQIALQGTQSSLVWNVRSISSSWLLLKHCSTKWTHAPKGRILICESINTQEDIVSQDLARSRRREIFEIVVYRAMFCQSNLQIKPYPVTWYFARYGVKTFFWIETQDHKLKPVWQMSWISGLVRENNPVSCTDGFILCWITEYQVSKFLYLFLTICYLRNTVSISDTSEKSVNVTNHAFAFLWFCVISKTIQIVATSQFKISVWTNNYCQKIANK